jgi:hypothetical protein
MPLKFIVKDFETHEIYCRYQIEFEDENLFVFRKIMSL